MIVKSAQLARMCAEAYEVSDFSLNGTECIRREVDYRGGSQNEHTTIFAFRGTERDFGDILTDMRGAPWHAGRLGWVHRGFWSSTQAYWDAWLKLQVKGAREARSRIVFTGHSLGGARATIAAALTITELGAPVALVTFGSPRVGLLKTLDKLITPHAWVERWVNGRDIVPTVPRILPWRHVGEARHIGLPLDPFRDHRIAAYIANLS